MEHQFCIEEGSGPAMNAVDELINYIVNFTPEQLEEFLSHPVTESILRPEEASEPCHQEAS